MRLCWFGRRALWEVIADPKISLQCKWLGKIVQRNAFIHDREGHVISFCPRKHKLFLELIWSIFVDPFVPTCLFIAIAFLTFLSQFSWKQKSGQVWIVLEHFFVWNTEGFIVAEVILESRWRPYFFISSPGHLRCFSPHDPCSSVESNQRAKGQSWGRGNCKEMSLKL